MMRNNKAEFSSQTFGFLTAAIIMGVILLFGSMSLVKLMSNVEEIESAQFRKEFESEINKISAKYGSVRNVELSGLRGYKMMCVVAYEAMDTVADIFDSIDDFEDYPMIEGDLRDGTSNIFLISNDGVAERFLNEDVNVNLVPGGERYTCSDVSSQGIVKARLEGYGKQAMFEFIEETS